ncbi:MAG: ABC transporter ATP-binding protein [Bdellovibrionota bacterium]
MNTVKTSSLLKISRQFAFPLWRWYLIGTIVLGLTNYVMLEIPELSKQVINGIVEKQNFGELKTITIVIILLGALQMLIRSLSRVLIFWPGRVLEADIKDFYFARFMKLPQTFFEKFGMGDLISRLSNDIGQLRVFYAFALLQLLNLIYLTVFILTKMISVHWQLTTFCLLPLGLMVIITKIGIPKMHYYSRINQDAVGRLTNKVTEAFVNIHTIQANSAKESFINRIEAENKSVFDSNMKLVIVRMVLFPLMVLFSGFSFLIVLYYGGQEVTRGNLTIGDIMAFNVYIGLLTFPLTALGIIIAIYQRAKTATDRLTELDRSEIEGATSVQNHDNRQEHIKLQPLLEIKNLCFKFNNEQEQENEVLSNINITIYPGEKIGICGKVGSGKSTLFNLITRIYDPPKGTIFWKGQDILSMSPEELRKNIGYALQSAHLFSESIAENLVFGTDIKPDDPQVFQAAKLAKIYDDIQSFPESWNTQIGEKGVRLSGGQKQRIALARIFIRTPEIFLLDDVTSALDHTTEQAIIEHIYTMNRTMVIASHRSSALQKCDKIYIFDQGHIIAQGNLESLKISNSDAFLSE